MARVFVNTVLAGRCFLHAVMTNGGKRTKNQSELSKMADSIGSGMGCTLFFFFFALCNSHPHLQRERETHYIINALPGILPCPRFTRHTLHPLHHALREKRKNKARRSSKKGAKPSFCRWIRSYQFPGFLLQHFVRTLHFLCSWVSCKAILAGRCSGPS